MLLFSTTFLLFFLLSWLNLRESRAILQQNSLDEASLLVSKSNQYLDLYAESVSNLFLHIQHETVQSSKLLWSFAEDSALIIRSLHFLPDRGPVRSSHQGEYDVAGDGFSALKAELTEIGQGIVWSEPYFSPVSGMTVSVLKRLEGESPMEPGTVIIDTDLDVLTEKVIGLADITGITLHVTSGKDAAILYDWNGPFRFPFADSGELLETLSGVPPGTSELHWQDTAYFLVKSRTNTLGWHVYAIVDPVFFSAGLEVLNRNFATLGVILFVLVLVSSIILSIIITRPVRRLAFSMDQVRSLDHLTPIANSYQDEFGELVDAYNSMMGRITNLTYEKNEFEWKMLQSQIGPHFLYNTLACINSLAKRSRTAEITSTIESLIHLLRYSFDRTASDVPLEDELRVLESYVAIQNIRYGDVFALDVDVPEESRKLLVPALLLQPVVENSIFHGFLAEGGSGSIEVGALQVNGNLEITVSDKGWGMTGNELDNLRDILRIRGDGGQPEKRVDGQSRDRMNAIGLRNIQQRLHVHYGEEYGVHVDSEAGSGTRVTLVLPAKTG